MIKKCLFGGQDYYPSGGALDFISFGTPEELIALAESEIDNYDWFQISDHESMKIELDGYRKRLPGMIGRENKITWESITAA